jgi:hypothetical protein
MPVGQFFRKNTSIAMNNITSEKLIGAAASITFDGTEIFAVVDSQLHDPELALAAAAIRHAILSQYRGCVPVDAIVEIVGRLLEDGELG